LRSLDASFTRAGVFPRGGRQLRGTERWSRQTRFLGRRIECARPIERARFATTCLGTVCLLEVTGEVDLFNSPALEAAIADASTAHRGTVLVSFAGCTFADCSALSVLIRRFIDLSTRLVIVAPPATALGRILDLANLTARLPVHTSVRRACVAISRDPNANLGDLTLWA